MEEELEKIRNGDFRSLGQIYDEYKPAFLGFVGRNFPHISAEDAEDIYQDTIIDFYQNVRSGKLTSIRSSLKAYLTQIGKFKLIKKSADLLKHENTNDFSSFESETDPYDFSLDQAVAEVFRKLSTNCKEILSLFYYGKMSMEEIAVKLGYKNAETVKSMKSRCIKNFSQQVNELYDGNL